MIAIIFETKAGVPPASQEYSPGHWPAKRWEPSGAAIRYQATPPSMMARMLAAAATGERLQASGDVDAVAQQVAVVLHHDVAEIDADAEPHAIMRGKPGIAR